VVTLNAFASRLVDQKRFGNALELLSRAEAVANNPDVFDHGDDCKQLKAFIHDTYAYYYFKRGKAEAALVYSEKAMKLHAHQQDWSHVAKCHLHSACILSRLNRKDEAVRCNGQVLSLVESGRSRAGGWKWAALRPRSCAWWRSASTTSRWSSCT